NEGPCKGEQRAECLRRFDRAYQVLETGDEPTAEVILAGARRRALEGHHAEASRFLAERCPRLPAPVQCMRERAAYALKAEETSIETDAITAYLAAACDSASECAKAALWLGDRM